MNVSPDYSTISFGGDRKRYLEEKLRSLEQNLLRIDWRLENGNAYYDPQLQEYLYSYSGSYVDESAMNPSPGCPAELWSGQCCSGEELHCPSFTGTSTVYENSDVDNRSRLSVSDNTDGRHHQDYMFEQSEVLSTEEEMVRPKLFLSWDCSEQDFNNRWFHKKIMRLLSDGKQVLNVDQLKETLEAGSSAEVDADVENANTPHLDTAGLSRGSVNAANASKALAHSAEYARIHADPGKSVKNLVNTPEQKTFDDSDKPIHELLNADETSSLLLDSFERKLKKVQNQCLSDYELIKDDDVVGLQNPNRIEKEILSSDSMDNIPILEEDLILDCFEEPAQTNYKNLPVPEMIKELRNLEAMVKPSEQACRFPYSFLT